MIKTLQWKTNMKSYVAYRMAALPMPLDDLKGHLAIRNLYNFHSS